MLGASVAASAFTPVRLMNGGGGIAACQAFYDSWYNVTKSGSNLASWADIRGGSAPTSAGSPMLPNGTGTKPTIAAGFGSPVVCSAAGATAQVTDNTALAAAGSGTFLLIGSSSQTGGTGASHAVAGVGASNEDNYVGTSATPHWTSINGTADVQADSAVASSGTVVRAVMAVANGTTGTSAVANHTPVNATIVASANTGGQMVLGLDVPSASCNQVSAHTCFYTSAIWGVVQLAYAGLYGMVRHGAVVS